MLHKRNLTTYRAKFSTLRMHAFGIAQEIGWDATVEIYQARVSPELWRARPHFNRAGHAWEAGSAETLMEKISKDFVRVVQPWGESPKQPLFPRGPQLVTREPQPAKKTG